jgi:hypothetical protein
VVRVDAPPRAGVCRIAVAFDAPLPEDCLHQQVLRHETLRAGGMSVT